MVSCNPDDSDSMMTVDVSAFTILPATIRRELYFQVEDPSE